MSNLYPVLNQNTMHFWSLWELWISALVCRRENVRSYSCFLFHPYGRGRLLSLLTLHGVAKKLCKAFKGGKFLEKCLQTFSFQEKNWWTLILFNNLSSSFKNQLEKNPKCDVLFFVVSNKTNIYRFKIIFLKVWMGIRCFKLLWRFCI